MVICDGVNPRSDIVCLPVEFFEFNESCGSDELFSVRYDGFSYECTESVIRTSSTHRNNTKLNGTDIKGWICLY